MRSALPRRGFLARIAALPIIGAGTSFFARRAGAATAAVIRQIDDAERRYLDTRQALEEALSAFEASFSQPHAGLFVDQDRWAISLVQERRLFDREIVKRGVDRRGVPCCRSIATVASLNRDLTTLAPWENDLRKAMRRLRRHAARHEMEVRATEQEHRLAELTEAAFWAQRAIHELAKAIFARPATTLAEIRAQARMLRVFAKATPEQWAGYQAGRYGTTLAANLDRLGAAA